VSTPSIPARVLPAPTPRAAGRNLRRPVVDLRRDGDQVFIRIDDDARPEFWVEVIVPLDALAALVGR
jgi:hypothetical protein